MKRSYRYGLLSAILFSSSATADPYTPPTVTVRDGATIYTITSQNLNYIASPFTITSQPWWGNATLSFQLADLVKMQAGDTFGSNGNTGAYFAYEADIGYVNGAYWNNNNTFDCRNVCARPADNYYYATLVSSSLVTLQSLASSLVSTSAGLDNSMSSANLIIHGAHSRPLSRRVVAGEKTVWVAGDLGRDDHGNRDGSTALAEIGGGYNFGPAQINLSLGKTWGNQDLVHNGDLDADGQYVMAESIVPLSESRGLYATVGAYGHWGEVDIRRGYLLLGTQDFSTASTNTRTWGVRARLDWENAFAVKSVDFSPYADLSYSHSHIEGYTETDGGLPARFDGRSDHSTEVRLGLNATMPISSTKLNVVANFEAAHRVNDIGSATTGEVIGLFAFRLPGEDHKDTWAKAGLGVEGALGKGKASLLLNATTDSSMPSAWLAASYQLNF